jgi:stage II sporulation protein R
MRNSHHNHSFIIFTVCMTGFVFLIGLSAILGQFATARPGALIPEDAIRIRIIAHSDNEVDQTLKYEVRDDVAAFIATWGVMPISHDEARNLIEAHLPEIQQHVDAKLREFKAPYNGIVELAKVPFPDKMFNGTSYAAGNYEALRITLGQGDGVNWWCVLFPPLCLTAATASDDKMQSVAKVSSETPSDSMPQAKFFLWEMLQKLVSFMKSLFS